MIVVNPTGGGLSNGKLAQATATPADVLSGKTFFAGGKDIKTGTFDLSLANATAAQVVKGYKFYAGNSTLKTGTLVPGGRIKTGSFNSMDEIDATLTIHCGFKPLMIVIDGDYTGNSLNGISITYCYTDGSGVFHSETIYKDASYDDREQVFYNVVSQTASGFIVKNVNGGEEGIFYRNRRYYYYAVG